MCGRGEEKRLAETKSLLQFTGKLIFVQLGMPNDRCFPSLLLENSQE